jgi:hypothetical protein
MAFPPPANEPSGDVWKLLLCLKKYRPELLIATADVPPTGLTVVRRLDPDSTVLSQNLEKICAEFIPGKYEDIAANKADQLNRIDNHWEQIERLFPEHQKPGIFARWLGRNRK